MLRQDNNTEKQPLVLQLISIAQVFGFCNTKAFCTFAEGVAFGLLSSHASQKNGFFFTVAEKS